MQLMWSKSDWSKPKTSTSLQGKCKFAVKIRSFPSLGLRTISYAYCQQTLCRIDVLMNTLNVYCPVHCINLNLIKVVLILLDVSRRLYDIHVLCSNPFLVHYLCFILLHTIRCNVQANVPIRTRHDYSSKNEVEASAKPRILRSSWYVGYD